MRKSTLITVLASPFLLLALSAAKQNPVNLEGTYRFVSRDLPDGTTMSPPDIQGLLTYTEGYRNFNIYWTDADGKAMSISVIAQYELSEETYSETNVYTMVNDEIGGIAVSYDLSSTSGSSPVVREEGSLSMTLPLRGEPALVVTADGITATREGEFVDHWERVE